MNKPLVSVLMTTYNHEKYLRRAVDSVLAQQTDFDYELVLGEDCSTDSTPGICHEYEALYPQRVRVVTGPENVGWRANYRRTFDACRGKYVAFCDGDDWWSRTDKLQRQVDLLESHPKAGMCYTGFSNYYEKDGRTVPDTGEQYLDFDRLLLRMSVCNCTAVARRDLVEVYYNEVQPQNHPEWLTDDAPMWLWFAAKSRLCALPDDMAVHRRLSDSVSHSTDYRHRMAFCDSLMDISEWMDSHYGEGCNRFRIRRKRSSVALWVLSFNGGLKEYIERWTLDMRNTPRLALCPEGYGLLAKKILFRTGLRL